MSKTEIDNRVATNMDLLAADGSLGYAIDIRREFCREAAATLRRLDAENKALRADAERYRWLRHGDLDALAKENWGTGEVYEGEQFDAAIDAAMAAAKTGDAA